MPTAPPRRRRPWSGSPRGPAEERVEAFLAVAGCRWSGQPRSFRVEGEHCLDDVAELGIEVDLGGREMGVSHHPLDVGERDARVSSHPVGGGVAKVVQ